MNRIIDYKSKFPYLMGFIAFITVFVVTQYLTFQEYKIKKEKEQELLFHELNQVNDKFRNILSHNIIATNALALIYKEYGVSKNFDSIAYNLVKDNKDVDALQLIQNDIVTKVYPLIGFEKSIGTNIYSNPTLLWEAKTAIKKREIFFAGPRKLLNGDIGIVGKVPVFINNQPKGFVTSIVKLATIKKVMEISNTDKDQFTYTLIKKIDKGRQTSFDLSDIKPNKKSQVVSIDIPRGNWTLEVSYSEHHPINPFPYTFSFFGILISLFSALYTYRKTLEKNLLKESVDEKNYLLIERIKELSTIYQIENVLSDENLGIDEKLGQTVNLIPLGFQSPEICQVKITFGDKIYKTKGYKESDICLISKIDLPDTYSGIIEVVYTEKPSVDNVDSFFEEELFLIESIAKKTSVYLKKMLHKEALDHSEELFKISFEKAAIGKVIATLDEKFIRINKAFCDMLGYSESELLELDFNKISYLADVSTDTVDYKGLLNGDLDTYKTEKRFQHKNGSAVWTNVNAVVVKDKNNNALYFILQIENITDKKESETIFKDLVEKSQVGVFIAQDNKFAYVNPEIIKELGYSEEEFIGMPATGVTHIEDVPTIIENLRKRELGIENRFRYESRLKRKDGSLIWVELYTSGTIYKGHKAIIGTLINITDEKNAIAEVEKSEANLKSIFNSTEVAYLLIDKDLNVLSFNNNFDQYHFERTGKHVIPYKNAIDQISFDRQDKVKKIIKHILEFGKTFEFEEEVCFQNTDQIKYYQFVVSPVKNDDEIIGLCAAIMDVTAKKNLELERELIINDLMTKNRDLEQFSYIVSHNMRVPVANLLGLVSMLQNDLESDDYDFIKEAFHQSANTLDKVVTDVNEVLNLRKNHLQTKSTVDLSKLINTIQTELDDVIQKTNAKIEYDFSASPEIYSIEPYLHNVFLNLISNSLKFTLPKVNPEIKIWSEKSDGNIVLHFKDNGTGIDLNRYGHQVFGLYKRFDLSKEGEGMGLFIAKAQINSMQGNISVKSNLDQGATFSITLPAEIV